MTEALIITELGDDQSIYQRCDAELKGGGSRPLLCDKLVGPFMDGSARACSYCGAMRVLSDKALDVLQAVRVIWARDCGDVDEHRAFDDPPRCRYKSATPSLHQCALLAGHLPVARGAALIHVCMCGVVMP